MSVPRPMTGPVTSRRTTLAGALSGLVALTGCDLDSDSEEPTPDQTSAPPADADAVLVERMQSLMVEGLATVLAVRREQPDLRRRLRPFIDLHGAHLQALGFEGERPTGSVNEVGTSDLGLLRRTETRLQRQLTDAAVRAESGALAKLLASMAAGVAQHLAVLA